MPDDLCLLYHEVHQVPGGYTYAVAATELDRHLALFRRLHDEAAPLEARITFDDGHRSNFTDALPALNRHGLVADFFITAGWTGVRAGYMSWTELRALAAAGHGIGAHGMTHTLLTHCSAAQLTYELRDARTRLEDGLGRAVTTMSLPGGRANQRVLAACREAGYITVFTSVPRAESRPLGEQAGRLNILSSMQLPFLEELFRKDSNTLKRLGRQHRIKKGLKSMLGDSLYAKVWSVVNRQAAGQGQDETRQETE